jgi:cytochrome c oxidase subunit II
MRMQAHSPRRGRLAALAGLLAGGLPTAALANDWQLNMPVGVTDISAEVYGLHMTILWICVVIGVVVFGAMIYAILKHRKSLGVQPAQFSHSTKVEIVWTVIPVLILIGMAIPATETLVKMEDTSGSDLTIKVTGYQWLWEYEYLDEDVRFFSRLHPDSDRARQLGSGIDPFTVENYLLEVDNRVVVPVDAKVRLLLTAGDVIHAWWVPDFAVKKDAIPGFINEVWFKANEIGVYRGQCAELCGRDHGFMPIVVEVKSREDYEAWLVAQRGDLSDRPVAATGL